MAGGYEERVLHVSCRMIRREVQCLEYMIVILDLRTFGNVISELAEYIDYLLSGYRYRMTGAELHHVSRHGGVERVSG